MNLTAAETRVLGCLIEKERTTPDYYPLTLNALITACNQSSNREPVVDYAEETVHEAMQGLRAKSLARSVKAVRSRALKHRHDLEATLRLGVPERSVLAIMLLRGPQTVGELRTRTDRYHSFTNLNEVEMALNHLSGETPSLAERLERRPGQKEARWRQLLSDSNLIGAVAPTPVSASASPPPPGSDPVPGTANSELVTAVAELTARVERLERELGIHED